METKNSFINLFLLLGHEFLDSNCLHLIMSFDIGLRKIITYFMNVTDSTCRWIRYSFQRKLFRLQFDIWRPLEGLIIFGTNSLEAGSLEIFFVRKFSSGLRSQWILDNKSVHPSFFTIQNLDKNYVLLQFLSQILFSIL